MKKNCWNIIINVSAYWYFPFVFLWLISSNGIAQPEKPNPFRGKKIAFYISKKQFQFSNHYLKPLNHFVSVSDTFDLAEEELKTATIIRLGLLFQQQFKQIGADSVLFVNSEPT
ncbi:MAG: hypothetical protein NZ108_11195, partial [Bacteroidia bacterium]|nr:hypothetical protein [Bacteroidia bacterium]